jgi:hypothetical protein
MIKGIANPAGWIFIFVAAVILYVLTLAPGLVWQDQGDYQYQTALCNLIRPGDLVRVHPLYILTAHILGRTGLFSYAYAANLVNALATCLTIANVYLITMLLVRRVWPAFLAAATYAMAHSVWFLGTQAQTYGMATAAMSGGVILLLGYIQSGGRWRLLLMGLLFGMGMSVHLMSQVAFAVIIFWLIGRCIRRKESITALGGVIICWILGAAALWAAAVIEYRHNGSVIATIQSGLVGKWGEAVFNICRLPILIKKSILFFVLNFPTPLVFLAIGGIVLSFKNLEKTTARLLLVITICYLLFAVRYDVPNQNNFFLPMYMFISVYIGLGFAFIFTCRMIMWAAITALLLAAIPATYVAIAQYASAHKIEFGTRRHIPYRDTYKYYLIPWQQCQTGPRQFATEMMEKLPPNAIVLADSTSLPPLLYVHEIEHARPDLKIFTFSEPKEEILTFAKSGERLFTISDVKGYYPVWVEPTWLRPFKLSETENIFEIIPE